MPAALESGLYHKEPAWHGLGKVVSEEITSTSTAIVDAGLDWEVVPKPVYVKVEFEGECCYEPVPGRVAGVRNTDNKVLSIQSEQFRFLQNKDAFSFFDPVLSEGICVIDSCGSLRGGKTIWVLTKLSSGMAEIVNDDPVQRYMLLANSHDGSISVTICPTNVRVVCQNTLAVAVSNAKKSSNIIRIRHTASLEEKLEEARALIDFQTNTFRQQVANYKYLASKEMTTSQFREFLDVLYEPELKKHHERKMSEEDSDYDGITELEDLRAPRLILQNFDSTEDLQTSNVRGTAWAAYNAVTQFVSHQKSSNMDSRMNSIWFGTDKNFLSKVEEQLLKV